MDGYELAGMLFGHKRSESDASERLRDLTISGVAESDSADGLVSISLDGDLTQAEDDGLEHDGSIVIPTEVGVYEGDEVAVTLTGADLSTLRVTGVIGNGDRQNAAIRAAQAVANAAQAVAEAVNQHFFTDTSGIHVTEATQKDWDESHTGANVLINSIGQLFRDGLNNLLSLTTENGARALTIWDGLGNTASNILARFSSDGISFADGTSFDIGDSSSYIHFDGNGHINIGGSGLTIGGYIPTGGVTVSDLTQAAQDATLNSNISVGGRNFLRDTQYMTSWGKNNGTTIVDGVVTFPTVTANKWREIYPSQNFKYDLIRNKQVTFSCEANVPSGQTSVLNFCIGLDTTETAYGRKKHRDQSVTITGTGTWQKVGVTADITDAWFSSGSGTVDYDNCWVTVRPGAWGSSWPSFQVRLFKLEVGNVATDWSPAPEDVAAYTDDAIDSIEVGGRNLVSSLATNWRRTTVSESSSVGTSWEYMSRTASTTRISAIDLITVDGDFVTVSLASGYDAFLTFFDANGYMKKYLTWSNQRTVDLSNYSGVTAIGLTVRKSGNSTITLDDVALAKIKLEKGNKATDWTPSPEDVDAAINNAAKTATSYVTEITGQNGIMVHPSTDQTTGVQITSDVDILRSGTSVANYGATARIGTSAGKHVSIDSDSVDLMDGNASLATFGANDTHLGMSGAGNVYMADDKFVLSAETTEGTWDSTEGSVTTSVPYTEVKSGFKAQNLGTNYHVYSGLNSRLGYNDDGGYTASDTYIEAWVEDAYESELCRSYIELWADPLYQTAIRLYGDSVELNGKETWYVSPYNEYPLQLGKPVTRDASTTLTIGTVNVWVDGPTVYLDKGYWCVVTCACFNTGSSSGTRKLRTQIRMNTTVWAEGSEIIAASNAFGRVQAVAIMGIDADETPVTAVVSSTMTFTTASSVYITAVQLA